jgi:hypothetical protein
MIYLARALVPSASGPPSTQSPGVARPTVESLRRVFATLVLGMGNLKDARPRFGIWSL